MKNSIWKKEIVFLIFLLILIYGVVNATPLIGSCYKSEFSRDHIINTGYINLTGITDLRFGMRWGDIDEIINSDSLGYYPPKDVFQPLLDSINKYVPSDVECIFQLKFWNAYKMADPDSTGTAWCKKDVYKVHPDYVEDFKDMCYGLGVALGGRVNYFVLHNQPNAGWNEDGGGVFWRNSPEDFAWQCKICAEQIKEGNPDAYVIYGGFGGTKVDSGFIPRAVNAIMTYQTPKIDAVDFHWYDILHSADTMRYIAEKLHNFTDSYDLDWTVLETNGPRIVFPLDSIPQGWGESIIDSLNDISQGHEEHILDHLRDCLYAGTRIVDPANLGLPENYNIVQPIKVDEFNGRVPIFIANGAKIVNWFSAYTAFDEQWLSNLDEIPCTDNEIMSQGPEGKVEMVIKSCQNWPLNVAKVDFGVFGSTDLSDRMKEYIDSLNLPKISPPGQKQMDINLRGITLCSYPNAFNSSTKISYYLPEDMEVKLEMFDILARKVDILDTGIKGKGQHTVIWDAGKYAGGVYFCRLSTSLCSKVIKMTLLK